MTIQIQCQDDSRSHDRLPHSVARFFLLVTRRSVPHLSPFYCTLLIRIYHIGLAAIFCVAPNRSSFTSSYLESGVIARAQCRDNELSMLSCYLLPFRIGGLPVTSLAIFGFGCSCPTMTRLLFILQLSSIFPCVSFLFA